jgi:hypothetical protein
MRNNGKRRTDCIPCRLAQGAAARYGVTVGRINEMCEEQGNRCAICHTHKDDIDHASFKHNSLVIDHDHKTGKVRGLLCPTCNLMVGHAQESPERLMNGAAYLTKHQ